MRIGLGTQSQCPSRLLRYACPGRNVIGGQRERTDGNHGDPPSRGGPELPRTNISELLE